MGRALGRVALATLLLLAVGYLLQAQDSLVPPAVAAVPAVELKPILTVQAGRGREYFTSRHEVVPVGAQVVQLPILMYHYIRRPPSTRTDMLGYKLSVAPEVFQVQMDWLYANHYHTVTFDQVRAYFAGAQALPSKPVVITFDDGYQDLYTEAFPILEAHGFTAVAYIVSGFVGRGGYVSQAEVLQMDRAGMEIASHTVNHANLARSSFGSVMYELLQSKRWLESLTGHPILDFAYPSGQFNRQTMAAVSQAGYDTAVTEYTSTLHSPADRFAWGRVRVGGGESLQDFVAGLGPTMPSVVVSSLDVEPS